MSDGFLQFACVLIFVFFVWIYLTSNFVSATAIARHPDGSMTTTTQFLAYSKGLDYQHMIPHGTIRHDATHNMEGRLVAQMQAQELAARQQQQQRMLQGYGGNYGSASSPGGQHQVNMNTARAQQQPQQPQPQPQQRPKRPMW